jgi:hypothetical protein
VERKATGDFDHFLPLVDSERRLIFLIGAKRSPIAAIAMVVFLAVFLEPTVGTLPTAAWAGGLSLIFLVRLIGLEWALKQTPQAANTSATNVLMWGTGILIGLTAFAAMLVWFPILNTSERAIMSMVYVGWIAAGIAAQSCYPFWTPFWVAPIGVAMLVAWARVGGLLGWTISGLTLLLIVLMSDQGLYSCEVSKPGIGG